MRKVIAALAIGFLLAAEGTHITYTCPPFDNEGPTAGCFAYAKAITYPHDLIHNKQNSLVYFSETFAEVSLISFGILWLVPSARKRLNLR